MLDEWTLAVTFTTRLERKFIPLIVVLLEVPPIYCWFILEG